MPETGCWDLEGSHLPVVYRRRSPPLLGDQSQALQGAEAMGLEVKSMWPLCAFRHGGVMLGP